LPRRACGAGGRVVTAGGYVILCRRGGRSECRQEHRCDKSLLPIHDVLSRCSRFPVLWRTVARDAIAISTQAIAMGSGTAVGPLSKPEPAPPVLPKLLRQAV